MSSGSDFHKAEHVGRCGIITKKPIKNTIELVEMLKSRDYELIKTID